jgi:hypothetical protein
MATPHIAGAWALLKSAKPSASVDELLTALQSRGIPLMDPRNGVVKSLMQIGSPAEASGALALVANAAPTISLTSPVNNAMVSAPANVALTAAAGDSDGTISRVEFYRDGVLIATVTTPTTGSASSGTWTASDLNVGVGYYTYMAKAYDNASPPGVMTSAAATVSVSAINTSSINVAAQANGGVAIASSIYSAGFGASGANNGDRRGLNWGNGGGWADESANSFPDVLQINFNSTYTITQVDVFTVQDNYASPVDPTASMMFTQWGITAFQVQYWNGSGWVDVPGGNITGNNFVWRRITFAPIATTAIRVLVNSALLAHARITEVEAWTASSVPAPSAKVNVAAQANGGAASGSSIYAAGFPASGANNGDRRGLDWGNGGGWADGTANSFPDVLQINFKGTYTIDEIDVFTVQDNAAAPDEPTASMTFTQWGITAFQVQYWNGSAWLDVPGGNIAGNNAVWRRITFTPVATNAIRVVVNGAVNGYARITEVEAWTQ